MYPSWCWSRGEPPNTLSQGTHEGRSWDRNDGDGTGKDSILQDFVQLPWASGAICRRLQGEGDDNPIYIYLYRVMADWAKSLYGMRRAARQFNKLLVSNLVKISYVKSLSDPGVQGFCLNEDLMGVVVVQLEDTILAGQAA